jgi:putative tryptophan/tyrosine transport system substrate-binding protein
VDQSDWSYLRKLLPLATKIAVLVNPTSQIVTEPFLQALQPAARELGIQLQIVNASTDAELDGVFASLRQLRVSALLISPDGFFYSQSERLGTLSLRYAIPSIYERRPFAASGGLISYGSDDIELQRWNLPCRESDYQMPPAPSERAECNG